LDFREVVCEDVVVIKVAEILV